MYLFVCGYTLFSLCIPQGHQFQFACHMMTNYSPIFLKIANDLNHEILCRFWSSHCVFFLPCVLPVPDCPHRSTEGLPFLPQELPLCWFDLYLDSFSAALWIKLVRGECLREAQSAASQLAPSCSQTEAFQIGFSQNLPIYQGTSLEIFSLSFSLSVLLTSAQLLSCGQNGGNSKFKLSERWLCKTHQFGEEGKVRQRSGRQWQEIQVEGGDIK